VEVVASSRGLTAQRVLVLNAGSSSLKWVVLDAQSEAVQQQGTATWEGTEGGRHAAELASALQEVQEVQAVGHRVVHGGQRFQQAVLVDEAVRQGIADLTDLAPLHNPAAVAGIDAARERFGPGVPQVAAFDTAFHASLPEAAAAYPLPWEWTQRWGLRRFGFHGLSVQHAVARTTELLQSQPEKLVVCHLGAGCSATAVLRGQSRDTSMGFTPLEGLMMVRRSGSVDPGLLLYLIQHQGLSAKQLDSGLNEQAGLAGVSGVSADLRAVLAAADAGDQRSRLALDMFVHRVVSTVGGLAAGLQGLDALVFTGGIGEHSAVIRAQVAAALGFLGLRLDPSANEHNTSDAVISASGSRVKALVITAREDLAVLREVSRVLGWGPTAP
jgi:acetate kinase